MSEPHASPSPPPAACRRQRWRQLWSPPALTDEVERHTAPAMQLLLLLYGLALPANWLWQLHERPIPPGWGLVLATDLVAAAVALAGVVLIRSGGLRRAAQLFIAAVLCSACVTWHTLGAHALLIDQTSLLLLLVIAGLVLGRRALWLTLAGILGVFAVGMHTDYHSGHAPQWIANAMRNGPSLLLAYLIIAFILDRTASALRQSLARERRHGQALRTEMARREQLQDQLLHAQRLEISGRLTSGVAHDFNNVLAIIQGFCDERDREAKSPRERERLLLDALDGIALAARRGRYISRSLLRFCRQDMPRGETFALARALAELQPMLRQLLNDGCRLCIAEAPASARLHMDRNQFDLVLLNLAANARDALQGRGTVRLSATHDGCWVRVRVDDDGPGMDPDTRQRMFEPFFSTKPREQGTGLGLAVTRDVVESSGGHIDVRSAPGNGTCVTLVLPAA